MSATPREGFLIIPDISGFTEFVHEVEIAHSEHIIGDLLELLISTNRLSVTLCEIEGDALFFYHPDRIPSFPVLLDQIEDWSREFHSHLKLISRDNFCSCGACQNVGNLGLKVVVHMGEFSTYKVQNRTKVIGKDVILVHRMLKNTIAGKDYALLSQPLVDRLGPVEIKQSGFNGHRETYDTFGEVRMAYRDLAPLVSSIPEPLPRELRPYPKEIKTEIMIDAPLPKITEVVEDIANWPKWVRGLKSVEMDTTEPLRDFGLCGEIAVPGASEDAGAPANIGQSGSTPRSDNSSP